MPSLLYVDDEETIGRAVARWFERRGHVVHVARSVDEAKRCSSTSSPDAHLHRRVARHGERVRADELDRGRARPLADRVTFVTGELADSITGGNSASGRRSAARPAEAVRARAARGARARVRGCAARVRHVTYTACPDANPDRRPATRAPTPSARRRSRHRRHPRRAIARIAVARGPGVRARALAHRRRRRLQRQRRRAAPRRAAHLRRHDRRDRRGARDRRAGELHPPLRRDGPALRDALVDAVSRGVSVRLLTDWIGMRGIRSSFVSNLRKAGVELRVFNPPGFRAWFGLVPRDHRKLLVVD